MSNPKPATNAQKTTATVSIAANHADPSTSSSTSPPAAQTQSATAVPAGGSAKASAVQKKPVAKAAKPPKPTKTEKDSAESKKYAVRLTTYLNKKDGTYLKDENGEFSVLLEGRRIAINHDDDNYDFASLLLKVCDLPRHEFMAKLVIDRLIDWARSKAGQFKLRKFSAMSHDGKRLYVPLKDSTKLLRVTTDGTVVVENGTNEDCLWIEHPEGEPLDFAATDLKAGLAEFEHLIVNSLACRVPEMRWFVAMVEALFPFVRDLFSARFITVHTGSAGSGKTTGAEFISRLHGLGEVKGDWTVPALDRLGDIGLLVMDNREQANMWQSYIDFLLFLATGAARGRCAGDGVRKGNGHRPIGAITSIEGAYKAELQDRCVEVEYNAHELERAKFPQDAIRRAITQNRHRMLSALVPVLQQFLKINQEGRTAPVPESLARFSGNFTAVCNLLRAYAVIAEKPADWSEGIIEKWIETITIESHEAAGDELETLIQQFLRVLAQEPIPGTNGTARDPKTYVESENSVQHKGQKGWLTVTTCEQLMEWFHTQDRHSKVIPKNTVGLGRRVRSLKSRTFKVLHENNAPELPQLKRKNSQRFIGFFEPDDETVKPAAAKPVAPPRPEPAAAVTPVLKVVTPIRPVHEPKPLPQPPPATGGDSRQPAES